MHGLVPEAVRRRVCVELNWLGDSFSSLRPYSLTIVPSPKCFLVIIVALYEQGRRSDLHFGHDLRCRAFIVFLECAEVLTCRGCCTLMILIRIGRAGSMCSRCGFYVNSRYCLAVCCTNLIGPWCKFKLLARPPMDTCSTIFWPIFFSTEFHVPIIHVSFVIVTWYRCQFKS